jgi:conjugal transfer pilus assembly protein TraE
MDPKRHLSDIQQATAALRRSQWLTAGMVLLSLLLAVLALTKRHTVILEPPVRTKQIAVVGDKVDGAWLEEMGPWIAHLMLDASPASIGWQHEQILRWAHPSTHGQLQQDMAVQAKRLREANAATIFWLQQTAPDPDRQRIVMAGYLETYVNGIKVAGSTRSVAYLTQFESKGGRMLLKEWKEVPTDDIWLARAQEQAAKDRQAMEKKRAAP